MADAPIHLWLDVTDAASARIRCWMDVEASGPEGTVMAFPRWIPGSYVIRDPVRMVRDLCWSSSSEQPPWDERLDGSPVKRIGINRFGFCGAKGQKNVTRYMICTSQRSLVCLPWNCAQPLTPTDRTGSCVCHLREET